MCHDDPHHDHATPEVKTSNHAGGKRSWSSSLVTTPRRDLDSDSDSKQVSSNGMRIRSETWRPNDPPFTITIAITMTTISAFDLECWHEPDRMKISVLMNSESESSIRALTNDCPSSTWLMVRLGCSCICFPSCCFPCGYTKFYSSPIPPIPWSRFLKHCWCRLMSICFGTA